jgi:hypothetical protein
MTGVNKAFVPTRRSPSPCGLPADVAERVVVMDRFWLPDAAQSLFARAQAVLSIGEP